MLMKPPPMLEEVISQDSENYTNRSKQQSSKGKNGKKENTIRIGAPAQNIQKPKEYDNESVHSNGSKRSKDKRAKQTTLGRPKIMNESNLHRQQDSKSVASNGSKNSHKSNKKQNNIMQRPKIQNAYHKQKMQVEEFQSNIKNDELSFKNAIGDPEQSIIKRYDMQICSPQPVRYLEEKKKQESRDTKNAKYAPFKQLERHGSQQEIPIYKIQQTAKNSNNEKIVGNNKRHQPKIDPRIVINKMQITQSKEIEESKTIIDQSKQNNTKSMRRPIFGRDQISNTSKFSNTIEQSNISGVQNSRRKSNSRLRQLFNDSRQKQRQKSEDKGKIENQSKISSFADLQSQSRAIKPAVGNHDHMVQLQRKVLDDSIDNFGTQSIKSGLDLTVSNHGYMPQNKEKDSLIFQFQPEKKKGMTVASKTVKKQLKTSQNEMINMKNNNLTSVNNLIKASNQEQLPKIINNNLISKQLNSVDKLLKENEEYLRNSGLLNLSQSYRPKRGSTSSDYLFKIQDDSQMEDKNTKEKPWHQIVSNYQDEVINIKKVDRNEKVTNKQIKQKESNSSRKEQQRLHIQLQKEKQQALQRQRQQMKRKFIEKQSQKNKMEQILYKQQRQQERIKKIEMEKVKEKQRQRQMEKQRQIQKNLQKERQRQKRQKQRLRQKQKQKQKQKQREIQKERQRLKQARQRQEQQKLKIKSFNNNKQKKYILSNIQSSISNQIPDNKSQNSNKSSKKGKSKKQGSIPRDKTYKIHIKDLSPRAQQSFYDDGSEKSIKAKQQVNDLSLVSKQQKKGQQKKPNLYQFSDDQTQVKQKPKSKTDMNFYQQSVKSIKPPSSRPPLSGKSVRSNSTSKQKVPKQSTIKIADRNKISGVKQQKKPKKLTLMERAMMKHNESSEEDNSQVSFSSRQDKNSKDSRNSKQSIGSNSSKNSRKNIKQNSLNINRRENSFNNTKLNIPLNKKLSSNSSHEQQLQRLSKQKVRQQLQYNRSIVSKNCTFIDERGRLVHKDLVIKGGEVFGKPGVQDSYVQAMERMKRTKQGRRSRSKSRQNKINRKNSRDYSENQSINDNSSYASSYYNNQRPNNSSYQFNNRTQNTQALKQFIKPVAQVPNYSKPNQNFRAREQKYQQQEPPKTFNEMFVRKTKVQNTSNYGGYGTNNSIGQRKSIKRTEKSNRK